MREVCSVRAVSGEVSGEVSGWQAGVGSLDCGWFAAVVLFAAVVRAVSAGFSGWQVGVGRRARRESRGGSRPVSRGVGGGDHDGGRRAEGEREAMDRGHGGARSTMTAQEWARSGGSRGYLLERGAGARCWATSAGTEPRELGMGVWTLTLLN